MRRSDAPDIDRDADGPDSLFSTSRPADEEREVLLDPETEEALPAEEFWREQRPPHY